MHEDAHRKRQATSTVSAIFRVIPEKKFTEMGTKRPDFRLVQVFQQVEHVLNSIGMVSHGWTIIPMTTSNDDGRPPAWCLPSSRRSSKKSLRKREQNGFWLTYIPGKAVGERLGARSQKKLQ